MHQASISEAAADRGHRKHQSFHITSPIFFLFPCFSFSPVQSVPASQNLGDPIKHLTALSRETDDPNYSLFSTKTTNINQRQ